MLSQGAQVDAPMSDGRSALEIATQAGSIDVATLLIEKKSRLEEEKDELAADALTRKSARKLTKSRKPRSDGQVTALVPKPPPKKRSNAGKSTKGAKFGQYNWECGEVEGRTMLFGAVAAS